MEARQVAGDKKVVIRKTERDHFEVHAFFKTDKGWRKAKCVYYSFSLVDAVKLAERLYARWEIASEHEEEPLIWRDEGGLNMNLSAMQPLLVDLFDSVALFLQGDITKEGLEEDFRIVWSFLPFLLE